MNSYRHPYEEVFEAESSGDAFYMTIHRPDGELEAWDIFSASQEWVKINRADTPGPGQWYRWEALPPFSISIG